MQRNQSFLNIVIRLFPDGKLLYFLSGEKSKYPALFLRKKKYFYFSSILDWETAILAIFCFFPPCCGYILINS